MNNNFFLKKARLLNFHEFVFVFQKPQRIQTNGINLFSRPNQLEYPRIGLAISKKYIQRSHDRNRIKRHIRETFRINQYRLPHTDFVFTVYSNKIIYIKNQSLIKKIKKLWHCHFLY